MRWKASTIVGKKTERHKGRHFLAEVGTHPLPQLNANITALKCSAKQTLFIYVKSIPIRGQHRLGFELQSRVKVMISWIRITIWFTFASFSYGLDAAPASLAGQSEGRRIEKLSLTLRGVGVEQGNEEFALGNPTETDDTLERMISNKAFIRRFAFYWSHQLGIRAPISWHNLQSPDSNKNWGQLTRHHTRAMPEPDPGAVNIGGYTASNPYWSTTTLTHLLNRFKSEKLSTGLMGAKGPNGKIMLNNHLVVLGIYCPVVHLKIHADTNPSVDPAWRAVVDE
ncbi:MAG: hypothetical protein OXT67_07890, partial [Zetaproteobacteria bacterium]|nr:hypothetical protein [Zetaproteobacteria bacterium]